MIIFILITSWVLIGFLSYSLLENLFFHIFKIKSTEEIVLIRYFLLPFLALNGYLSLLSFFSIYVLTYFSMRDVKIFSEMSKSRKEMMKFKNKNDMDKRNFKIFKTLHPIKYRLIKLYLLFLPLSRDKFFKKILK